MSIRHLIPITLVLGTTIACGGGPPLDEIKTAGEAVCACDTVACADAAWRPLTKINKEWGNPKLQKDLDPGVVKAYNDAFDVPRKCKQALAMKEFKK